MTIKRLEVALRKMDFKLLKDGTYKLHEKYHSGYKFEYLDLLKEILDEVNKNISIPSEIKDILIPTIEDILSSPKLPDSDNNENSQNRVSSLTSLSYNTNQEYPKKAAFDAFSVPKTQEPQIQMQMQTVTQSPFSAEPFKEFSTPKFVATPYPTPSPVIQQPTVTPEVQPTPEPSQPFFTAPNPQPIVTPPSQQEPQQQIFQPINENVVDNNTINKLKTKTISIFYGQDQSEQKINNVLKYRKIVSNFNNGSTDLKELIDLIFEINTQTNTSIVELKTIIDQLHNKESKINIVTNSQSSTIIDTMEQNNYSYTLYDLQQDKKVNLIPILGLTNLYKCSECSKEYLNLHKDINPYVLQCPQCKKPMLLDIYCTNGISSEINLDYYNASIKAFTKSNIWLLIHPMLEEKVTFNLLKNALLMSDEVNEIYILDKDINTKETCKKIFLEINPKLTINTQTNALENFFGSVNRA